MKIKANRFNQTLVVLLILLIPKSPARADDIGFSLDEWKLSFRSLVNAVIETYYGRLAKTAADTEVALEAEADRLAMMGRIAAVRMGQARKSLSGEGATNPGPTLRDARLTSQAGRSIADQAAYFDSLFKRTITARNQQCSPAGVKELVTNFKSSGLINTRSIVESLQAQISNLSDAVAADDVTISIGYSSTGGTNGGASSTMTVSGDRDGPQKQKAIVAAFTAAGAYAGAAIGGAVGSAVPIAGTTVGALIGGFIGSLIGSILGTIFCGIFFSDPYVKAIKKVQEQSDFVMDAVYALDTENISDRAVVTCRGYFQNQGFVDLSKKIETRWPVLMDEIKALSADIAATEKAIEEEFATELNRLRHLVYPTVEALVNERFDACYAQIKQRSAESRKFANETIPGPLKKLLDAKTSPSERLAAEAQLWSAILEGDTRFSATKAFSFQSSAVSEPVETLAWDGVARAVYRKLDSSLGEGKK